ncbi:MAG: DNA-binding protein [Ruminococcus sp.]|nr:DNA-binding protein [Ruminococcus sp.]
MVDMEKIVSTEQLSDDKKELAEIIGLDAYKKLVQHFCGSYIYVNKPDTVTRKERDAEIFRKFDGKNYCQLAQEYNLTENRIRSILKQKQVIL